MRIAVVGGALQGMEAVYLAKRAGFETVVIDRKPNAPALSLCDVPVVLNPLDEPERAMEVFRTCDAIMPACEELDLLTRLDEMSKEMDVPLMFDRHAYEISCSKNRSNEVMESVGVPLPQPWPECGFPVIVKPSCQSGSVGVSVAFNQDEVDRGLETIAALGDEPVIQEFVHGKSVSIEVIGNGSTATSYVTTEVVLDSNYDCKMVRCNTDILSDEDHASFGRYGKDVAESIGLSALMDVEAILTPKGLRILEIDARIPSQTPAAIEAATGVNLLAELVASSTGTEVAPRNAAPGASIYRHVVFEDGVLRSSGEKEFGKVRSPRIEEGLFGADRVITDYEPGKESWRATIIVSGTDAEDVESRSDAVIVSMMEACGVDDFLDGVPEVV